MTKIGDGLRCSGFGASVDEDSWVNICIGSDIWHDPDPCFNLPDILATYSQLCLATKG